MPKRSKPKAGKWPAVGAVVWIGQHRRTVKDVWETKEGEVIVRVNRAIHHLYLWNLDEVTEAAHAE